MKNRIQTQNQTMKKSYGFLLLILLSYVFLLLMSYGFPILGDDWYFAPRYNTKYTLVDPFVKGWDTAAHHYITTNGRLLGNFLVKFTAFSKLMRELIRCGIILGILLCVFSISVEEKRGRCFYYLIAFTLLVAIPARIAGQTYAWSSGFFNYVPPTLLFLLYARYVRSICCAPERRSSVPACLGMFLLGLAGSFFIENQTIAFCLLSLAVWVLDWIRRKKPRITLLLCFLGSALGCVIMFKAPGYHNVGVENYRTVPQNFSELIANAKVNFNSLSACLTRNNPLVVSLLSLCGAAVCLRRYPKADARLRLYLKCSIAVYLCCPLLFYAQDNFFSRYHFWVDLGVNGLYFLNLLMTGLLVLEKKAERFNLVFFTITFVLFIAPLMAVHPVGPRNAYFFDVLMIVMCVTLLRAAVCDLKQLRPLRAAVCFACCLLLLGNLWIYYRNGKVETLRHQIVAEAMERGDQSISLPLFPYELYTHRGGSSAIKSYYYYEHKGDITFEFIPYKDWISSH